MKVDVDKIKEKKLTKDLLEFGIINIDKPSGPTSFDVSDFVRKKLDLRKTSHFGTLDPKVTGVLPIALNRACKLTGFFLGEDKEYIGVMRFHEEITIEKIKEAIKNKFTGKIMQKPPVKSRVKRVEREREIIAFEILEVDENGKDFLFRAEVQGGTYIRKLIDDLGKELKMGAHMLELRRIRAGIFKEDNVVNLYDYEKAVDEYANGKGDDKKLREMIIPGEIIAELYPVVNVKDDAGVVKKLYNGSPLFNRNLSEKVKIESGRCCVFSGDKFIGIYSVIDKGEVYAMPEFVLQPIK